jgi:hypothetical protein
MLINFDMVVIHNLSISAAVFVWIYPEEEEEEEGDVGTAAVDEPGRPREASVSMYNDAWCRAVRKSSDNSEMSTVKRM